MKKNYVTFNKVSAQGDVLFIKVDSIPSGMKEVLPEHGQIVVTHSETGHNHVMVLDRPEYEEDDTPNVQMFTGDDPLNSWLKVNRPTTLDHLRSYDTHKPIMFSVGLYEVRRQREHTPEGWRQVRD